MKIDKVLVYPQCYGAIFDKLETMSDYEYVVDIGSWTVDILKVVDADTDESFGKYKKVMLNPMDRQED